MQVSPQALPVVQTLQQIRIVGRAVGDGRRVGMGVHKGVKAGVMVCVGVMVRVGGRAVGVSVHVADGERGSSAVGGLVGTGGR